MAGQLPGAGKRALIVRCEPRSSAAESVVGDTSASTLEKPANDYQVNGPLGYIGTVIQRRICPGIGAHLPYNNDRKK
jgi:hypothetical protein